MEMAQLRYMAALAQELHFRRAAQKSHVTQPTLSQSIQKLEKELGVPLFERSARGVRLTPEGKKFLSSAVNALDHLDKTARELQESSREAAGTVRIGVLPTVCPYLMPQVITRLEKTAPRIKLELSEETTSILVEQIKNGTLDLGIAALPVNEKGLVEKVLWREPFYLAVARDHPLVGKKAVTQKEMMKEKVLVLEEGRCFGQQALEFCGTKRQDAQVVFQGSSLTSVMKLAALGEGVALVPQMALPQKGAADLRFIPFAPKPPFRELGVLWRLSVPLAKAGRALIEAIEQTLKAL